MAKVIDLLRGAREAEADEAARLEAARMATIVRADRDAAFVNALNKLGAPFIDTTATPPAYYAPAPAAPAGYVAITGVGIDAEVPDDPPAATPPAEAPGPNP